MNVGPNKVVFPFDSSSDRKYAALHAFDSDNGYPAVHNGYPVVHNGYPGLTWVGARDTCVSKNERP